MAEMDQHELIVRKVKLLAGQVDPDKLIRRGKIGEVYLHRRNFIRGFYGSLRTIPDAP